MFGESTETPPLHVVYASRTVRLEILDYRRMSKKIREDFDSPEWGSRPPILLFTGDVARRPNYWQAMCKLLGVHPILLFGYIPHGQLL